jgi:hypothetical protein
MKKDFQSSIARTYLGNPLMKLVELGWSSADIKRLIIETLEPYFSDKQFLRDKAIDLLSGEAVNVGMITQDAKAELWFRQLLDIRRLAAKVNEQVCFRTEGLWEQAIAHGRDEFWSGVILERNLSELPLEDFKFEAFRAIGTIIEACLQPLLKALLAQVRLARGDLDPNKNLDEMELGKVVDELFAKLPAPELVAPAPWNVRLNQWRNMAQHHKTQVKGDKIYGVYGVGVNAKEIALTRTDVLEFAARLNFVLRVVRGSRAIFLMDNLQRLAPYFRETREREDIGVFLLAAPFATQGFKIDKFEVSGTTAHVRICDKVGGDVCTRTIHCSQLIYSIWLHFPYDAVEIEFVDVAGSPRMRITASGSDLARCNGNPEPWEDLANAVKFHPLKSTN